MYIQYTGMSIYVQDWHINCSIFDTVQGEWKTRSHCGIVTEKDAQEWKYVVE